MILTLFNFNSECINSREDKVDTSVAVNGYFNVVDNH